MRRPTTHDVFAETDEILAPKSQAPTFREGVHSAAEKGIGVRGDDESVQRLQENWSKTGAHHGYKNHERVFRGVRNPPLLSISQSGQSVNLVPLALCRGGGKIC